jgi:hypothetical protein
MPSSQALPASVFCTKFRCLRIAYTRIERRQINQAHAAPFAWLTEQLAFDQSTPDPIV